MLTLTYAGSFPVVMLICSRIHFGTLPSAGHSSRLKGRSCGTHLGAKVLEDSPISPWTYLQAACQRCPSFFQSAWLAGKLFCSPATRCWHVLEINRPQNILSDKGKTTEDSHFPWITLNTAALQSLLDV